MLGQAHTVAIMAEGRSKKVDAAMENWFKEKQTAEKIAKEANGKDKESKARKTPKPRALKAGQPPKTPGRRGGARPGLADAVNMIENVKQAAAAAQPVSPTIVPLNKRIKDVLSLLFEHSGQYVDVGSINESLGMDLEADTDLYAALRDNVKVEFQDGRFKYKPTHAIMDKEDLLHFLKRHPTGISSADIKDSYKGILEDCRQLKEDGKVYMIHNIETDVDIIFPDDERFSHIKVDQDIVDLYRQLDLPTNPVDLQSALSDANIKSATANRVRKVIQVAAPEKKERKKRAFNQRFVTNQHLPELFMGEQPDSIDRG